MNVCMFTVKSMPTYYFCYHCSPSTFVLYSELIKMSTWQTDKRFHLFNFHWFSCQSIFLKCLRFYHVTLSKYVRSHAMCDVLFCGFAPLTPLSSYQPGPASHTPLIVKSDDVCAFKFVILKVNMNISYAEF